MDDYTFSKLTIENFNYLMAMSFMMGVIFQMIFSEIDVFVNFLYKLFRKHRRLRKIQKLKESRCLDARR